MAATAFGEASLYPRKRKVDDTEFESTLALGNGRFASGFRPRKMCNYHQAGRCFKGDACTFAHDPNELHPEAPDAAAAEPAEEAAEAAEGEWPPPEEDEGAEAEAEAAFDLDPLADGALAEELDEAEGDLAEEDPAISSALGPRNFPIARVPRAICADWLMHPSLCAKGDRCPNGHGLAELNWDGRPTVIRCGTGSTATVTVEDTAASGGGGGGGGTWAPKGGKGIRPLLVPKGGKGGKPAANLALPAPKSWQAPGAYAAPAWEGGRFADGGFRPTRICNFWLQDPNACTKGDDCTFAHGVHELQPAWAESSGISRFHHMGKAPTRMCTFFASNACTKGLLCTFAHSEVELQG